MEELNITHFEEAFKRDGVTGDYKLLHKFGLSHLKVQKNELQRVYLAVQSLNDSMSCMFQLLGWEIRAMIIRIIDRWFHVCDSRSKDHEKPFKSALGTNLEEQFSHLQDMIDLMAKIEFRGGHRTKPFQKGIVAGCKSMMALSKELRSRGQDYICTYQLNQDALELHFSLIRSLVTHPRAAQFVSCSRALFFSSHTMNILEDNSPVSVAREIWEPTWNQGLEMRVADVPVEASLLDKEDELFLENAPVEQASFLDVEDELLRENPPGEQTSPSHQIQAVAGWISHKVNSFRVRFYIEKCCYSR